MKENEAIGNLLIDMITPILEGIEIEEVERKIAHHKRRLPRAKRETIADILIREKALWGGVVGGVSSIPTMLPGIGSLISAGVGGVCELGALLYLQSKLIMEIAVLYGYSPIGRRRIMDVLAVLSGSVGANTSTQMFQYWAGKAVSDQLIFSVANQVARKMKLHLLSRGWKRFLPITSLVVGGGMNYKSTYDVGKVAQAYYQCEPSMGFDGDPKSVVDLS